MHENHASIVALHRLKTFFKKSADTFASTQYIYILDLENFLEFLENCRWVGTFVRDCRRILTTDC